MDLVELNMLTRFCVRFVMINTVRKCVSNYLFIYLLFFCSSGRNRIFCPFKILLHTFESIPTIVKHPLKPVI